MKDDSQKLQELIDAKIEEHKDGKTRWASMKTIKWALYCPQLDLYAGLSGIEIIPVTKIEQAQIFDGRDNQELKISFYRVITGVCWQIKLL